MSASESIPVSAVASAVETSLEGLRLLDHPYYRKWQDGLLELQDLGAYAGQYLHFERQLPEVLSVVADQLPAGRARDLVSRNLEDECSRPEPHAQLFQGFASAVGADDAAGPTDATVELVSLYRRAVEHGPIATLAVIAAYEVQAGDIATTKASSLRRHYGLGPEATRFWAVHSEMEDSHAAWTTEALELLEADAKTVSEWSSLSADTWWRFLDDRLESAAASS
jgi:pyrroloquinoline quinone (PQQ) biosynthesis protein C